MKLTIALLLIAVVLVQCKKEEKRQEFVLLSNMNKNIKPGDNFFQYVNGAWFDTAEIPATESSTGCNIEFLIQTGKNLNNLLAEKEGNKLFVPEDKRLKIW